MSAAGRTLAAYLLTHDLPPSTVAYYRRWVSLYGQRPLTANGINRWLAQLQEAGKSSWYRRSLRNGLSALLHYSGRTGVIRQVRLTPLDPIRWTKQQIEHLVDVASHYPWLDATYWPTLIRAAWLTGLNQCDLEQLQLRHFAADGQLHWRRSKTNRLVVVVAAARVAGHQADHQTTLAA